MRKYLTIVMLSIILAPFMARMFYTTFFYFNQSSIARELCVNRGIANNTCKGKCFLKKQLEKVNTATAQSTPKSDSKEKVEEKVFFTEPFSGLLAFYKSTTQQCHFTEHPSLSLLVSARDEVFHPPLV